MTGLLTCTRILYLWYWKFFKKSIAVWLDLSYVFPTHQTNIVLASANTPQRRCHRIYKLFLVLMYAPFLPLPCVVLYLVATVGEWRLLRHCFVLPHCSFLFVCAAVDGCFQDMVFARWFPAAVCFSHTWYQLGAFFRHQLLVLTSNFVSSAHLRKCLSVVRQVLLTINQLAVLGHRYIRTTYRLLL